MLPQIFTIRDESCRESLSILIEVVELRNQRPERVEIRIIARKEVTRGLALQHCRCLSVPIANLLNEKALAVLAKDFEVTIAAAGIDDHQIAIND